MQSKKELVEEEIRKSGKNGISIAEISRNVKITYSTAHKWVKVLELEGKVKSEIRGSMKIVKVNN